MDRKNPTKQTKAESQPGPDAPAVECPREVKGLVQRFDRNREAYRSPAYKEAQVRAEFIEPFFKALGWDVYNEDGYAEAYKDVIHEDAIKVGGATKAPDYCFRIGGTRKFFVEAKKPAADIAENARHAYQLRRYAWSAKLPLSILTDFEELAVYDCRVKPAPADSAPTARTMYLGYEEYATRWGELGSIFSKGAVLQGSFDKYAESTRRKRGTAEVDDAFLKEIENWRELLARNIALRNPELSQRDMNFAVARTIDRIIFLRMCEDRGVEDYGRLQALLNGTNVYGRLCELFRRADERYNSGLFHFRRERGRPEPPDELTPGLIVDDRALKEIFKGLYYPDSPYEFSVLPADILGHVYEQFLGKVIRLTRAHQAKVEDKPEVKKAGGVYYTPTYIVDYIVKHTVGKLLEGKTPRRAAGIGRGKHPLRVLDPACGSGSFLIGAYQCLLDWHRDWYVDHLLPLLRSGKSAGSAEVRRRLPLRARERAALPIYQVGAPSASLQSARKGSLGTGDEWRLTTAERKRILLAHIYGVDIDPQAVEVTKLSLLLKVLEGESRETLDRQQRLFHERALPDLASNVKCGNSLIGPDFYDNKQMGLFDEDEGYRINAFDWESEFPEVFAGKTPGFDAVIGNPPWGAEVHGLERAYLKTTYSDVADFESSQYFLVRTTFLANCRGLIGMIVPNTFALNVLARRCRDKILRLASISGMLDLSNVDVFAGPNVRAIIVLLSRQAVDPCRVSEMNATAAGVQELRTLSQRQLQASETWKKYFVKETDLSRVVSRLLEGSAALSDYCSVRQGYIPYRTTTLTRRFGTAKAKEIVKNRLWHSRKRESREYLRELQGRDVGRYSIDWSGVWVRYGEWVSTYLPASVFSGPRVLVREITRNLPHSLLAAYTEEVFVHNPSVLAVLPRSDTAAPTFVLGVLNSVLMSAVFMHVAPKARKGLFPKIIITDARRLPFPRIDLDQPRGRSQHDTMVQFVERMLALHRQLGAAKTPHDREVLQRQIDTTDRQIDRLVYELYDLTDEEIRIVEEATRQE